MIEKSDEVFLADESIYNISKIILFLNTGGRKNELFYSRRPVSLR